MIAKLAQRVRSLIPRRKAAEAPPPVAVAETPAEADAEAPPAKRRSRGWVVLAAFWAVLLVGLGGGAGALHYLGPLPPKPIAVKDEPAKTEGPLAEPAKSRPAPTVAAAAPPKQAPPPPPRIAVPAAALGDPVPPPDPALSEPGRLVPGMNLPRVAADGRTSRQAYAAAWDRGDRSPRVAILITGIGMNEAESLQAIADLPSVVSFGVNPYAFRPARVLEAARNGGHEVFLSLPLEPANYPLNDPGPLALLSGLAPAANAEKLERVLGLFGGYVGVTTAMGGLRGERFAGSEAMMPVLEQFAARGLIFVDGRAGAALPAVAGLYGRAADLVLDEPPVRAEIEARLARLEEVARAKGAAIGVTGSPAPLTVARILAWSNGLAAKGLVLVPVSALATLHDPKK